MKAQRAANDRRPRVLAIALDAPVRAVRATLIHRGDKTVGIRANGKTLMATHPIHALCVKLHAAGCRDSAMLVSNPDHAVGIFVASIHALATWPAADLALHWPTP